MTYVEYVGLGIIMAFPPLPEFEISSRLTALVTGHRLVAKYRSSRCETDAPRSLWSRCWVSMVISGPGFVRPAIHRPCGKCRGLWRRTYSKSMGGMIFGNLDESDTQLRINLVTVHS
jgi:hypothetical protein